MTAYDIFICYRTTFGSRVEARAKNLRAQGYSVFLDQWELLAGQNFIVPLQSALQNSKCGILVATPDASDSGWVQMEYEQMVQQKKQWHWLLFYSGNNGPFSRFPIFGFSAGRWL